jgi:hypothetical protein
LIRTLRGRRETLHISLERGGLNTFWITIKVCVDGVEHLVDETFFDGGFQSEDGFHELFLGDFSLIVVVGHSEDISEGKPHFFGPHVELAGNLNQAVGGMFLFDLGKLADMVFLMFFCFFVAKSLIDFLLSLQMVLQ